MKTLIFVLFVAWSAVAIADDATPATGAVDAERAAVCEQLKKDGLSGAELAKRGCCSWHGGVCGCSGGRLVCCDGVYSPTCTCHKEQPVEIPN